MKADKLARRKRAWAAMRANHQPTYPNKVRNVIPDPEEARSLMFARTFDEVKKEYVKKGLMGDQDGNTPKELVPRRERRRRMIRLARRTMRLMREEESKYKS